MLTSEHSANEWVMLHPLGFVHVMASARSASWHRVPLHKLVVPLDGCTLTLDDGQRRHTSRRPLFVPQGVAQAMHSNGPTVAVLLDTLRASGSSGRDDGRPPHHAVAVVRGMPLRSSRSGSPDAHPVQAPIRALEGRTAERLTAMARQLRQARERDEADALVRAMDAALLRPARLDRRVARVVEQLVTRDDPRRSCSATLAAGVRLSRSRLSHLFQQQSGVSMRAFASLLRVRRSLVSLLRGGASIAAVAADSGFADQAHLTRMCRSRFGRTPRAVQRSMLLRS